MTFFDDDDDDAFDPTEFIDDDDEFSDLRSAPPSPRAVGTAAGVDRAFAVDVDVGRLTSTIGGGLQPTPCDRPRPRSAPGNGALWRRVLGAVVVRDQPEIFDGAQASCSQQGPTT